MILVHQPKFPWKKSEVQNPKNNLDGEPLSFMDLHGVEGIMKLLVVVVNWFLKIYRTLMPWKGRKTAQRPTQTWHFEPMIFQTSMGYVSSSEGVYIDI